MDEARDGSEKESKWQTSSVLVLEEQTKVILRTPKAANSQTTNSRQHK
jgi:hypothetical protein